MTPASAAASAAAARTGLDRPVPPDRIPDRPPEQDGRARDDVALVVTTLTGDRAHRFVDLPDVLAPGDLLVVNDSATLPASLPVLTGRETERLHLSGRLPDGNWIVEVRRATRHGSRPAVADHRGRVLQLPDGAAARLHAPYPAARPDGSSRLWVAEVALPADVSRYLHRHGRPIRYGDPAVAVRLPAYQTIFARSPGSAEMPSAARPFTAAVLRALRRRRVRLAAVTLHAGVSSLEAGERPHPEAYEVPAATAALVNATHRRGHRVIAVGTTVARALETVVAPDGDVVAARGWTGHLITAEQPPQVLDGLLTGWHEPEASHLDLLAAVVGAGALGRAYDLAHRLGLRWHEFGDSHLILRDRPGGVGSSPVTTRE